jgi:hypothetical protein
LFVRAIFFLAGKLSQAVSKKKLRQLRQEFSGLSHCYTVDLLILSGCHKNTQLQELVGRGLFAIANFPTYKIHGTFKRQHIFTIAKQLFQGIAGCLFGELLVVSNLICLSLSWFLLQLLVLFVL